MIMGKRFEYRTINFTKFDTDLEKRLNEYGERGWEVIGYSAESLYLRDVMKYHYFVLKREKK